MVTDATHFAVWPLSGRAFGFRYSWNGVDWPDEPPQMVTLPTGGWVKQITAVNGMIEDPLHKGTVTVFFTGVDGRGVGAVGSLQALVSYS